jgi:site-specific DNA-cytosine methylase
VFIVASRGNHRRPVEILFEPDSSSRYLEESGKKRKRVAAETERSLNENCGEKIIPIHDKATRFNGKRGNKNDGSGNGLGIGKNTDPMNTLTTNDRHSVFIEKSQLEDEMFLFQCNRKDDHRIHRDVAPTLGCFVGSIPLAFAQRQSHSQYVMDDIASTITTNEQKQFSDLVIMNEPKAFDTYNHSVNEMSQTLRKGSDGEHIGTVWESSVVRRVTPKECERLQGFPDDWTASQPNSSRYKMMGNAVSVPVVEWIIKRMVKLISE